LLFPVLKDNSSSEPHRGLGDNSLEHPPDNDDGGLNDNNTNTSKLHNDGNETDTNMDELVKLERRYIAGIDKQIAEEG
jgi:hypothetical protein